MGLECYFLHDFFTARELNELERRARRERTFQHGQRLSTLKRAEVTEEELGRVALLARSLAELCLAKGLITAEELRQRMLTVDAVDGARDAKLAPGLVEPGSTKPKMREPSANASTKTSRRRR
jgi:hypothetical protein